MKSRIRQKRDAHNLRPGLRNEFHSPDFPAPDEGVGFAVKLDTWR